jgi:hypothetical protein
MIERKKSTGLTKSGRVKRGRTMAAGSPQSTGAGRVPVTTVKVAKKPVKLKPMGMTYGSEAAGKPATKRVKKAYGM